MSIKLHSSQTDSGVSLVETLMGLAVGMLVIAAICAFALFNARGFAGFSSYTSFDNANRKAMDQMTKDFRMVQSLTNFAPNTITLLDFDGTPLKYYYNPTKQVLNRVKGGVTNTLLTDCNRLAFSMRMRNMSNGTFDLFPTTNVYECKAITIDWCSSRKLLGNVADDMPQSETIVIRN